MPGSLAMSEKTQIMFINPTRGKDNTELMSEGKLLRMMGDLDWLPQCGWHTDWKTSRLRKAANLHGLVV
ncbi:hypothetical protein PRZ48_008344 [Zasmidium cellare]|uniref:DAGKc domain-containing protein n=1 Tax=Zasmidium cellare TaxID=395010 RepID=A0ABR0EGB7_ZASCE|nr:hypothetical protein PRZ48_008344 [Zasmidium cellare]